jgi:hypothetical protein
MTSSDQPPHDDDNRELSRRDQRDSGHRRRAPFPRWESIPRHRHDDHANYERDDAPRQMRLILSRD